MPKIFVGRSLKANGQEKVLANESKMWREKALSYLNAFATMRQTFGADDFREYCRGLDLEEPHHPNVWGSLFTSASKQGWISPTGKFSQSKLANAHAHHYPIWCSNFFAPKDEAEEAETAAERVTGSVDGCVGEAEALRYELRAPGKPGASVKTRASLLSPANLDAYCARYKVERSAVAFYAYIPFRLKDAGAQA